MSKFVSLKKWIAGCALLGAALGASVPVLASDDPVLATVVQSEIRLSDLRDYVKKNPLLRAHLNSAAGARQVLEDMINARLLALEGQRLEMPLSEGEQPDSTSYVIKVRGRLTERCSLPGETEAKAYYEQNPDKFTTPAFARVARLYLSRQQEVNGVSAKDYLTREARAIIEGRDTFDGVIEKTRPFFAEGAKVGDMGFLPLNEKNPLIEAIAAAPLGALLGPVEIGKDVFLFQVLERREPVATSWENAKADAAKAAYQQCRSDAFQKVRAELVTRFPVQVNEEEIAKLKPL